MTANHAVMHDENVRVGLAGGKMVEGSLVGRDPTTDLALLRIDTKPEQSSKWTGSDDLKVGQIVLALARPGKTVRAGFGVISALGESWRTPFGGTVERYLESDAPGYPGYSGGPLVTVEGSIAGINTSGLLRNTTVTVPTATIKCVVEELLKHGKISRGYLGVGIQPARLPPATAQQLAQETGLLVISVDTGSPGDRAGIVMGDTIISIAGKPVRHWDDLLALLGKDQVGQSVVVRILRAGQLQELKATIGERE